VDCKEELDGEVVSEYWFGGAGKGVVLIGGVALDTLLQQWNDGIAFVTRESIALHDDTIDINLL
jgi:hypothetical protein